jgi:hypothetical protein
MLARVPKRDDDRGTLALLLMVILVGATLGGLMLAMILNQDGSTQFDTSRVHALDAAQSGIDVVLGEIRASTTTINGTTVGATTQLPCGPVAGNPNGTGPGTFSTTVTYYTSDPSKSGATVITCTPGSGTGYVTPHFALISSTGTDGTGRSVTKGRTLTTTYTFQTTDATTPGGTISIYPATTGSTWCMDAGSATPTANTPILLRACSTTTPPTAQQDFAYRSDLSIQLVSSVSTTNPYGLCLDTNPTTHANGDAIVLTACSPLGSAPWNQKWSVDDVAHLHGANTDGSDLDGYCINVSAQASGQAVTLAGCAGGTSDTSQTWVPSLTAGDGAASQPIPNTSPPQTQIVNYQQFATCIDVTNTDPSSSFLILYTCKQNPTQTSVRWNQRWAPSPSLGAAATAAPATVLLKTADTDNNTTYCLQSPLTAGGYVTVTTNCTAGASNQFTWNQIKDASGNNLPYAKVYTIVDSSGLCLSSGPIGDVYLAYYKVVVTTCDGGTEQKWNANPSVLASRLTNTKEN